MTSTNGFWEEREQVERFAAREPDVRLAQLVGEYPAGARVLDVGCAGGRNTIFLAERGFDTWAVDSSLAMVQETRLRLARILGEEEASRRVRRGTMDRLDWAETEGFDLVVALGVYHCAESREEWERALSESARVLKAGGRCLVSAFTPQTDLTGRGTRRLAESDHVYEGFRGGRRSYLVEPPVLDREMARHGLLPISPTQIVRRDTETGRRVSANGLYRKVRLA